MDRGKSCKLDNQGCSYGCGRFTSGSCRTQIGAEAAISAMKQAFDEVDTEGVMLVDAKNAFNNMNRQVALHRGS